MERVPVPVEGEATLRVDVREADSRDRGRVEARLNQRWGGPVIWSRGVGHPVLEYPALIAETDGTLRGFLVYRAAPPGCEIVVIDAWPQFKGIGSALIEAVAEKAKDAGCSRLWLVTTNDNLDALRFYQRRGFGLARLHRGAVDRAREMKPSIPAVGYHGIPIRDEVELERDL